MARLTREQSQAITRERLLDAAGEVIARDGYDGASVERIADAAGYSKGAFYSNFSSKEDLLAQLLSTHAVLDVVELKKLVSAEDRTDKVIDVVAAWSDSRAAELKWGLIAIEYLRRARRDGVLGDRHRNPFIAQWLDVGELLSSKLFGDGPAPIEPVELGGIVLDLTYGGIATFLEATSSGRMLRDILVAMVRAYGESERESV